MRGEILWRLAEESLIMLSLVMLSGIESSLWCVPVSGILFVAGLMMMWMEEL